MRREYVFCFTGSPKKRKRWKKRTKRLGGPEWLSTPKRKGADEQVRAKRRERHEEPMGRVSGPATQKPQNQKGLRGGEKSPQYRHRPGQGTKAKRAHSRICCQADRHQRAPSKQDRTEAGTHQRSNLNALCRCCGHGAQHEAGHQTLSCGLAELKDRSIASICHPESDEGSRSDAFSRSDLAIIHPCRSP